MLQADFNLNTEEKQIIVTGFLSSLFELFFSVIIILSNLIFPDEIIILTGIAFLFTLIFNVLIKSAVYNRSILFKRTAPLFLSYLIILILLPTNSWIVITVFVAFLLAKSSVGIISNKKIGSKKIFGITNIKSFVFAVSVFVAILFFTVSNFSYVYFGADYNPLITVSFRILSSLMISIIVVIVYEIFSEEIRNLFIPFIITILLFILLKNGSTQIITNCFIAFLIALVISSLSYAFKFLTLKGALAQFVLATFIFGFGRWQWTIPIIVFFLLSSILSKFKSASKRNAEVFFEKTSIRDSSQVLVNGGIGGILVLFNQIFPSELFFIAYVSSLSAVCADTWATEIGTLFKTKTVSIKSFKEVIPGTSGGISFNGILGALLGAFIIPVSSLIWLNSILFIFLITLSGFTGSLVDSFIGATLQAQYECKICRRITERKVHCNNNTSLIKGYKWLDNDKVNFITALFGGIMIIILKEIVKV